MCIRDRFTDAPVTTVKKQILEIPSAADEEGYWLYDSLDNGATVAAWALVKMILFTCYLFDVSGHLKVMS